MKNKSHDNVSSAQTNSTATITPWLAAGGIFLVALLLRLTHLYFAQQNPTFYTPTLDEATHLTWAEHLVRDHFVDRTEFFRAPLYPYFLAMLISIFGKNLFVIKIVQCVLGSAVCSLLFITADRSFNRTTAWIVGIWASCYWLFIYYDSLLLVEGLLLFWLTWLLFLMMRPQALNLWHVAAISLLTLASIYTRPNFILFVPVLLIWVWQRSALAPPRTRTINASLFTVMTLLGLFSYGARNHALFGYSDILPTQGGINFYIGNRSGANGREAMAAPVKVPDTYGTEFRDYPFYQDNVWYSFNYAAYQALGRQPNQSEVSSYWYQQAYHAIQHEPSKWLELMAQKFYYLFNAHEIPSTDELQNNWNSYAGPLAFLEIPLFGLLLTLCLCSVYLSRTRWKELWPLYSFLAIYGFSVVLFFVNHRFRLPMVPVVGLLAAYGVATLWQRWREQTLLTKDKINIAVITLLGFGLSYSQAFNVQTSDSSPFAFNLGNTYMKEKRYEEAVKEFTRAAQLKPSSTYWNALAFAQIKATQYDAAMQTLQAAVAAAPNDAQTLHLIGLVYYNVNNKPEALNWYRRVEQIDANFNDARYWFRYGVMLDATGERDHAQHAFKQSAQQLEKNLAGVDFTADDLFLLGITYSMQNELNKARDTLTKALEMDPQDPDKHFILAQVLGDMGEHNAASLHEQEGQRLQALKSTGPR